MTEQAVNEAQKYVEQSLEAQKKLGYAAPAKPVVKAAVSNAAKAVDALLTLKAATKS
jgi:hypothetical protein